MKAIVAVLLAALGVAACAAPVLPASPPTLPETSAPAVTPPQSLPPSPPPPSPSPSPVPSPASLQLQCGRIDQATCSKVEALIRQQVPFAAQATAIVMDNVCQPDQYCVFGFHAVVSILIPRDPSEDYAYWPPTYSVIGDSGPERVLPWSGPLPVAFMNLLRSVGFQG